MKSTIQRFGVLLSLGLAAMLVSVPSRAADQGVKIIPNEDDSIQLEFVSTDDVKLKKEIEVPGFGSFRADSFEFREGIGYYREGRNSVYDQKDYSWSGVNGDYAVLHADIMNTNLTSVNFMEKCTVKVLYDEGSFVWEGRVGQHNINNQSSQYAAIEQDKNCQNEKWVIKDADAFPIDPMYEGHYSFWCNVPNYAVNGKASLQMVISFEDTEFTYTIRQGKNSDALTDALASFAPKGEPGKEADPDDMQLQKGSVLGNKFVISPQSISFKDLFGYYRAGRDDVYDDNDYYRSGGDADYVLLYSEVLNLQKTALDFAEGCSVKVVYDDKYTFAGWVYQQDYNNASYKYAEVSADVNQQNYNWVINPEDNYTIGTGRIGHYVFGCTVPNAVVASNNSLDMIITLRGEELVFHIR